MAMVHIHDGNFQQFVGDPLVSGDQKMRGLIPRDYGAHPIGSYSSIPPGLSLPLMSDEDIQAAIKRKNADQSWLSDLREVGMFGQRIPSRDQNGQPYCWNHSVVSCNLLARARDNQPFADLSAYAGACIIKNYRSEGGWGAQGLEWMIENGCPTSKTWPQKAMSRSHDNAAMRAEATLYKPTGAWQDMRPNDDRALATCLCKNCPCVVEYSWWAHSVCACRLISWKPLKILIWNSWADSWSENGMGELSGSKASPDSLVALMTVRASA